MEYRQPEEESSWIGPHKSTNTHSNGHFTFSPSLTFDTRVHIYFPLMQESHFGGVEDRSMAIPSIVCFLAISMIALKLQWPSH